MKRNLLIALLCVAGLGASGQSYASEVEQLQQQLEALSKRVAELEKRVGILDKPEVQQAIREVGGPESPGDSQIVDNWNYLKVGYDYDEVKELLGEPLSVKKGSMEFWFYSDQGTKGPFVKFLFRKVNSWKAPGQ